MSFDQLHLVFLLPHLLQTVLQTWSTWATSPHQCNYSDTHTQTCWISIWDSWFRKWIQRNFKQRRSRNHQRREIESVSDRYNPLLSGSHWPHHRSLLQIQNLARFISRSMEPGSDGRWNNLWDIRSEQSKECSSLCSPVPGVGIFVPSLRGGDQGVAGKFGIIVEIVLYDANLFQLQVYFTVEKFFC